MTLWNSLLLGLKVVALTIILTVSFIIGAMVSGMGRQAPTPGGGAAAAASTTQPDPATVMLMLLLASLVQAVVVAYLVMEARWDGWKIAASLFLVFLNTFLQARIETAVYLRRQVPSNLGSQMLVTGLVIGLLFAPLAVLIMGRFRRGGFETSRAERPRVSLGEWVGKFAAVAVVFVAIYYLCGYYIAWQSSAVRFYYTHSTELKSFWGNLAGTWSATPWMMPLQSGRGLLWLVMTLPAVWMLGGSRRRVAFGTALMYAALGGSAMLILPNPLMPPQVAHAHLIETTISGLLFGAFVGWLMKRQEPTVPAEKPLPKAA